MRSTKLGNQSCQNAAQRLLFVALLLLAPLIGRADEYDERENHLQRLIDMANGLKDKLGPDVANTLSKGGAQFVLLGEKADLLMGALEAARPRATLSSPRTSSPV